MSVLMSIEVSELQSCGLNFADLGFDLARYLVTRYPATQLSLWGESLGTGVAIALAATHPVGAVILDAPFTSAADVGAGHYPFLPHSTWDWLARAVLRLRTPPHWPSKSPR